MAENPTKEKLNEKYFLYQVLTQNLENLKQQLELVEQQLIELKATSASLSDLSKINESNEIFMPLGSGCFGVGKITDGKKILLNAGAGVFVSKDIASAKTSIEENFKEIEKAGLDIEEQMKKTVGQINEVAADIQEMASAAR
jgi:prefoldin alpha subunit